MQPETAYYAPGTPVFVETAHEVVELGTVRGRRIGMVPLYVVQTALGERVSLPGFRLRRAPFKAQVWLAAVDGRPVA